MSKYKAGDKFEIRIAEEYNSCTTPLFRVAGFNSLVFDENGLDKLKKIEDLDIEAIKKETYEQGANDAWEIAGKVVELPSIGGYTVEKNKDIFGVSGSDDILDSLSGVEAIKKVKEYEKKQSQLKVGDIVKINDYTYRGGEHAIVISIVGVTDVIVLHDDFEEKTMYRTEQLTKVGIVDLGE